MTVSEVRWARLAEMPPAVLYSALRLRFAVFGIEQFCLYEDMDGRDVLPTTWHAWVEDGGEVVSYLRVLGAPGEQVIGRVVTAVGWRGRGLGRAVMESALGRCARPVKVEAQTYLLDWYASFGFVPRGPEYLEDGIPHTPMLLT